MNREEVIRVADECGAYRYVNRAAKDEPTHTFTIEKLERFYNLAFEAGRKAEREDAERYRWLRDNSAYVGVNPHSKTCLWVLRGIYEIDGAGFDESVDAAIRARGYEK